MGVSLSETERRVGRTGGKNIKERKERKETSKKDKSEYVSSSSDHAERTRDGKRRKVVEDDSRRACKITSDRSRKEKKLSNKHGYGDSETDSTSEFEREKQRSRGNKVFKSTDEDHYARGVKSVTGKRKWSPKTVEDYRKLDRNLERRSKDVGSLQKHEKLTKKEESGQLDGEVSHRKRTGKAEKDVVLQIKAPMIKRNDNENENIDDKQIIYEQTTDKCLNQHIRKDDEQSKTRIAREELSIDTTDVRKGNGEHADVLKHDQVQRKVHKEDKSFYDSTNEPNLRSFLKDDEYKRKVANNNHLRDKDEKEKETICRVNDKKNEYVKVHNEKDDMRKVKQINKKQNEKTFNDLKNKEEITETRNRMDNHEKLRDKHSREIVNESKYEKKTKKTKSHRNRFTSNESDSNETICERSKSTTKSNYRNEGVEIKRENLMREDEKKKISDIKERNHSKREYKKSNVMDECRNKFDDTDDLRKDKQSIDERQRVDVLSNRVKDKPQNSGVVKMNETNGYRKANKDEVNGRKERKDTECEITKGHNKKSHPTHSEEQIVNKEKTKAMDKSKRQISVEKPRVRREDVTREEPIDFSNEHNHGKDGGSWNVANDSIKFKDSLRVSRKLRDKYESTKRKSKHRKDDVNRARGNLELEEKKKMKKHRLKHRRRSKGSSSDSSSILSTTSSSAHSLRKAKSKKHTDGGLDKAKYNDSHKKEFDSDLERYAEQKIQKITVESISRTGGVYVPPFKLAALENKNLEKNSPEYQKRNWEALRKSINGLTNKVNVSNIAYIVKELFVENLLLGRGLFVRALMRAQMSSIGFTHIYVALLCIVNSKLPEIGELLIKRTVLQFRRAYRRNDKIVCMAVAKLFAHLINFRILDESFALQLAYLLLQQTTDNSIEVCVFFIQECGQVLTDICRKGVDLIFERFRTILQEGKIEKKTQYVIEKLWDVRRTGFKDFPGVIPELDLVEEDDKIIHQMDLLDEQITGEEMLNIFKPLPAEEFEELVHQWTRTSKQILGEECSDGYSVDSEASDGSEDSADIAEENKTTKISDMSEQGLINLRKTIYLCIMSSINYEECVHKLLKLNITAGQEIEVCTMLIDCSAMERTFQSFFALQGERLARINEKYLECFIECFEKQYNTIHRLETNKLRNTAKFFAHMLYTGALPWTVFEVFVLTEETTTSSGRIFIKIIFQELCENLGLQKLNDKLNEPILRPYVSGLLPMDNARNMRFAINFFTAIGLGGLTEELRRILAEVHQKQKNVQKYDIDTSNDSNRSSSDDSDDSDSDSDSDSSTSSSSSSSNSSSSTV